MTKPSRHSNPAAAQAGLRTFFVTSRAAEGKALLQTDRMATLFIDVLHSYVAARKFVIHDFVVMPNHVRLLLTVDQALSIERAVQLVKGNFSYRAKKELGLRGEIWQRGFSEVRVYDRASFLKYREYIENNPVQGA